MGGLSQAIQMLERSLGWILWRHRSRLDSRLYNEGSIHVPLVLARRARAVDTMSGPRGRARFVIDLTLAHLSGMQSR
jgi:hypothetical protein